MKIVNQIFLAIILSLFITSANAKDPMEFIGEVTNSASNILKEDISIEQKADKLIELAEGSVDISGIGMYSLGKHRKSINDEKLIEYKNVFREYFLKSFSSRLSQYSDPKINVLSQNVINEKYTIVSSVLVATSERPEIKIEWRVYTKDSSKPFIRDLIIEGLSLARTQKEEFASILGSNNNDINSLFEALEKFVNK